MFLVAFAETEDGLRISGIVERPAASPEVGLEVLTGQLGWPVETKFEKHSFGTFWQ